MCTRVVVTALYFSYYCKNSTTGTIAAAAAVTSTNVTATVNWRYCYCYRYLYKCYNAYYSYCSY